MTISNLKKEQLIETNSQKAKDAKPVGKYTRKELIALEHKWRLKLKSAGFVDMEMWDNKPRKKVKRIRFIKGHIRMYRYRQYVEHVTLSTNGETLRANHMIGNQQTIKFWKGYSQYGREAAEYFRIVGIFAHHAPDNLLPSKYRKLLQVYATTGVCREAIRRVAPTIKPSAISKFITTNFPKMLEFVVALEKEEEENEHRLRTTG